MISRLFTALLLAAGALAMAYVASLVLEPSGELTVATTSPDQPHSPAPTETKATKTIEKAADIRTAVVDASVHERQAAPIVTVTQTSAQYVTNDAAVALIKTSEGLRLEAYPGGYTWLIGYGHARTARKGMTITEAQAEALLRQDLADCEQAVTSQVTKDVTENMFGALVSFCYNLGPGGMARSSIISALNAGDYRQAADNFLLYNKAKINGEKQVVPHLAERREKERALFLAS